MYKLLHCDRTIHGSSGISKESPSREAAIVWFKQFIEVCCDKMPTKDEIHIPFYYSWNEVYIECNFYLEQQLLKTLSDSQLSKIRHKLFPKLKKPPFTKQGKCDECVAIKQQISSSISLSTRLQLQQRKKKHNEQQRDERIAYRERIQKAVSSPDTYMSLIFDGMAQVLIPMVTPIPKGSFSVKKLKTHFYGLN